MIRHKDLAAFRNKKLGIKPGFFYIIEFADEFIDIQRNAVSDDANGVFAAHAAGHKVQGKSAVLVNDCVARVGTTLKTYNNICLLGKHICDLTLALIAPVRTDYCSNHNTNSPFQNAENRLITHKRERGKRSIPCSIFCLIIAHIKNQVNKLISIQRTFFRFLRFADRDGVFVKVHDRYHKPRQTGQRSGVIHRHP